MIDIKELELLAEKAAPASKIFFKKNKKKLEKMDTIIHTQHAHFSEKYNCLECANCCRTLGPAIYDKDIERMAKSLRMKPAEVIATYLKQDDDNDYVFKTMPCPFLLSDNYCAIYENRPKACREYPHTDRKRFSQIFLLSVKNAYTCPIVYEVIEQVKKSM
jgi:uncharacterized protein